MRKFLMLILSVIVAQIFLTPPDYVFAAEKARGLASGGKGLTKAAAIDDMELSIIKRVLGGITERSDDPDSPYQQLLKRYKEFVASSSVEKLGKASKGFFVTVTGNVVVKYDELQAALRQLVKGVQANDDTRSVNVFIRVIGADSETDRSEDTILRGYIARLRENHFAVENADEVVGEIKNTRAMNFDEFVDMVRKKSEENPSICTAIIGEINVSPLDVEDDATTAVCEVNIRALDCFNDFKIIDEYIGSEMIRAKDSSRVINFLMDKTAINSAKAITDSLVKYWTGRGKEL